MAISILHLPEEKSADQAHLSMQGTRPAHISPPHHHTAPTTPFWRPGTRVARGMSLRLSIYAHRNC